MAGHCFQLHLFSVGLSEADFSALETIVSSLNNGNWGYVNQMSMPSSFSSSSKLMKLVFNCRLKITPVIRANAQIISVNFTASSGCYLILILIVIAPQRELN